MSSRYIGYRYPNGYRYPKQIIGYVIWLYYRYRFLRDVSEILLQRGIVISHETIRTWCKGLGPILARDIRKKASRLVD